MIIWDYFVICVLLLRSNIFCLFFAVAVGEFSPFVFKLWELEGIHKQSRDGRKQLQILV